MSYVRPYVEKSVATYVARSDNDPDDHRKLAKLIRWAVCHATDGLLRSAVGSVLEPLANSAGWYCPVDRATAQPEGGVGDGHQ